MSTRRVTDVCGWIQTRIDTITTASVSLRRSPYRFVLAREPDCEADALYYVECLAVDRESPWMGTGEKIQNGTFAIQIGYYRAGGDLNEGDRFSAGNNAADDVQVMSDVLEDALQYDGANTGIRIVQFQAAQRVRDTPTVEIWEHRYRIQWLSDVVAS